MGRGKNTIKLSDISTAPILTKYSASYTSQSIFDERYGITSNRGTNEEILTRGTPSERALKYRVIKQLYYQNYLTGSSFSQTASYWDSNLQSTAASGTFDDDYRYFPSGSGDDISFLAIPALQFGEQIRRNTFLINSNTGLYSLRDDGNGNILDVLNSNVHVGNILYAQGIATITNEDYVCTILDNTFSVSVSIVPTPIPSATPSITPSITRTPTVTPTRTVSITPSLSVGASVSLTPSISITPSISLTPSITRTPSVTPQSSVSLTPSISLTPSKTPTVTPSRTPSTSVETSTVYVYAKYINSNGSLQYNLNGGGETFLSAVDSLTCILVGTLNINPGDSIVFSDPNTNVMSGDLENCPANASSCDYTVASVPAGISYVYITINGLQQC